MYFFKKEGYSGRFFLKKNIIICRLALYDLGRPHAVEWIIHHVRLVEGWSMAGNSRGKGS